MKPDNIDYRGLYAFVIGYLKSKISLLLWENNSKREYKLFQKELFNGVRNQKFFNMFTDAEIGEIIYNHTKKSEV